MAVEVCETDDGIPSYHTIGISCQIDTNNNICCLLFRSVKGNGVHIL